MIAVDRGVELVVGAQRHQAMRPAASPNSAAEMSVGERNSAYRLGVSQMRSAALLPFQKSPGAKSRWLKSLKMAG